MRRALELAERGAGQVSPNPLVGAVVAQGDDIVGEGWHATFGADHAEVMALNNAGAAAQRATVYVTLEPCAHAGQTPPCTQALLDAGVSRVVFATRDPNPLARGGGDVLAANGVAVTSGVCEREARDRNAPFLFALQNTARPFVTLKLATSIDGALVDASRHAGWMTGDEARAAVHRLRAECDAIAVGVGTALADDPALTVRYAPAPRIVPRRVVFDRQARLPLESELVRGALRAPVIVVAEGSAPRAETALRRAGVEVLHAASLSEALAQLRAKGMRHLLVEGGAILASALLEAGMVDRLVTFQAPIILGAGALPAFAALPSRASAMAPRLRVIARREYGSDLMTTFAVSGD